MSQGNGKFTVQFCKCYESNACGMSGQHREEAYVIQTRLGLSRKAAWRRDSGFFSKDFRSIEYRK